MVFVVPSMTRVATVRMPSRSTTFRHERQLTRKATTLQLDSDRVHGPVAFLNPTRARFTQAQPDIPEDDAALDNPPPPRHVDTVTSISARPTGFRAPQPALTYQWTSRDNRKGRQTLLINATDERSPEIITPPPTAHGKQVLRNVGRMFTSFPVWDISFNVAIVFTIGSAIWVLNGLFVLLPLTNPESDFPGEALYGGGITAFIGGCVFQIGGVLMFLEALVEDPFGAAISTEEGIGGGRLVPRQDPKTGDVVRRPTNRNASIISLTSGLPSTPIKKWIWLPSCVELRTHYFHDIGFLACLILFLSATIFFVACITSLPPIYESLDTPAKLNGAYWAPQVIGGLGFVLSGAMFILETQERWWWPAIGLLGWWVGLWNLLGGVGFTLCPIFGLLGSKWALYQASLTSFWGSLAFLIGSVIQWYESLIKYPVEKIKDI